MADENYFLKMALNNAWANATLFAAMSDLPTHAFTAPRPGFFASLSRTMNHIHEVDLYYLDALEAGGKGRAIFQRNDEDDPRVLARQQADSDMRLAVFCKTLTPETLRQTRATDRREGTAQERVDWLLLHLVQHQIHHRGQAHVQLQDAGVAPPQLDDFYLTHGRAPSADLYWS